MNRLSHIVLASTFGLVLTSSASVFAQLELRPANPKKSVPKQLPDQPSAKKTNDFLRLQRSESGEPLRLQTAITSYKPDSSFGDLQVDLVGAVHVGDKEYYKALNKKFETYDIVLYELVAPRGTRIPKGGRKGSGGNPISMLQGMTKSMLNLASQMDEVDYTKDNFVHADMSPAEMQESMSKRGETPMTVALDAFSEMMKQSNLRQAQAVENNEPLQELAADPLSLLFDPQRDTKLKVMMAEQFATMGTDVMGGTVNRVLIEDRNAAAMQVFQKEVVKGHKKIAIFYGAAHLPDFEERLTKDFDLKRAETEWLTAWDLKKPSKQKADDPVNSLFRSLLAPPSPKYQ